MRPTDASSSAAVDRDMAAERAKTRALVMSDRRREEVTRLIIQALHDLGYDDAGRLVQQQSQLASTAEHVDYFRNSLLQGDWEAVEKTLPLLPGIPAEDATMILFYLREQKFLEALEATQWRQALHILRTQITPLNCLTHRVHALSNLIMMSDVGSMKRKIGWDGGKGISRANVLQKIQEHIPASVMLPEHRLFTLLEQSIAYQKSKCVFHNCLDDDLSLFSNHECDPSTFPTETKKVLDAHADEVFFIAFSHDGRYLASASKDASAILYDVEQDYRIHQRLHGHEDPVSYLAWSPDDSMLLTCSNDEHIRLWKVATGACLHVFRHHTEPVTSCAWLPDNQHFVSGALDKNMFLQHIEGKPTHRWTGARVTDLVVTSDGSKLLAVSGETKIRVYDLAGSKAQLFVMTEHHPITSVSLSHDNRYVLANLAFEELHVWNLETQQLEATYKGRQQGRFVIRSCFGGLNQNFVVSGSEDRKVYIWEAHHPEAPVQVLVGHTATVNAVAWHPKDARMLASASDDHTIRM